MKLLKYLPLVALAAVLTGCSNAGPEPDAIAPGVYFPLYNKAAVKINPLEETSVSFNADLCRTFNTVGTVVNFTTTIEKQDLEQEGTVWVAPTDEEIAWFKMPKQVVFDNNYSKVTFDMTVITEDMEYYQPYRITLAVAGDTQVSAYGSNKYTFTFTKSLESWSDIGTALFADGWILSRYSYTDGTAVDPMDLPYEVPMQQNDGEPFMYRLVNPYNQPTMPIQLSDNIYNYGDGDAYIEINLENEACPIIVPQFAGFISSSNGTMEICNIEGYLASLGADYDQIAAELEPGEASEYEDGFLYIPTCYFFFDGQGLYTWSNAIMNGAIQWPDDPEGELSKRVATANKPAGKNAFKATTEFAKRK